MSQCKLLLLGQGSWRARLFHARGDKEFVSQAAGEDFVHMATIALGRSIDENDGAITEGTVKCSFSNGVILTP